MTSQWDEFLRCSHCGIVFWKHFNLTQDELNLLYNQNYFNKGEYEDYVADESNLKLNFEKRINVLKKFSQSGKILEIGSAYGFFLDVARNFWDVQGIDITQHGCQYAETHLGLPVICDEFIKVPFKENDYDVICFWDTLEHLKEPVSYLEKATRCLKKDGYICITTGDIGSLNAKIRGRKWRMIHPPTHLFYFSKPSITYLFNEFGLSIVHFSKCANYRSINSILNVIARLRQKRLIFSILKYVPKSLLNISLPINLFDIMFVIGKKV